MFLTDAEICELTQRTQHSAQIRVLCFFGIAHKQRPDGSVAVLRAHVEKEFGHGVVSTPRRKTVPDFSMVM